VLIAVVCLTADVASYLQHPAWTITWEGLLAIVIADAALALPPRYTGLVVLAHALIAVSTTVFIPGHQGGLQLATAGSLVAAYLAGAWLRGNAAWLAGAALAAGTLSGRWFAGHHEATLRLMILVSANVLLPWLVGRYATALRAYVDELRHRGENERRDAEAAVAEAVIRERTAIARDLHDVISHHVSAIGMHAGAARMTLAARPGPDAVAESLNAVETSSRAALADLRKLLDLLHGAAEGIGQPGLDNLDELLAGVRRSGLDTRLSVDGPVQPLPSSLDIALYRVVQEMLTNALRHSDGGPVDISIHYDDGGLTLTARNGVGAGAPRERTATSRGLASIRNRVAMFEGSVSYGPGPDGQWTTTVSVPV
jgi:signal transduction histidine kinase